MARYPAFSWAVRELNDNGMTYQQMEDECGKVRSLSWWNRIARELPSDPPPVEGLDAIAQMMGGNRRWIEELVAEQWYGVSPGDGLSTRARRVATKLDALDEKDFKYVQTLVARLARG